MPDKKQRIIRALQLTLAIGILGFLIPLFVGLSQGGFDAVDILNQYNFYSSGGFFIFLLLIAFTIGIFIDKDDRLYGDSAGYVSHGENPHFGIFKYMTLFQMFLLSVILFSILGIFSTQTNQTTFTGLAVLEQQFTPVGSILFSTLLIPISENAGFALMLAAFLIVLRQIARKTNMGAGNYRIIAIFVGILLAGIYGFSVHLLRYGGSEVTLGTVGLFWAIGGFITLATGSFIPFWIMHVINNLLFDMQRFISSDTAILVMVGFIVASISLYLYLYGFSLKSKRSQNE